MSNIQLHTHTGTGSILLSAGVSGITGEIIKGTEITGNPVADLFVKIMVPILTGISATLVKDILIPVVKLWIYERKQKIDRWKKK